MKVILARNVNDAWLQAKSVLKEYGVTRESRVGPVLEAFWPVATMYERPMERILFDPIRDVNPFFHFFEGLWMLAGRDDVEWISQYNSNIAQYSDNGLTFHGAYGFRWRQHFQILREEVVNGIEHGWTDPLDQLQVIIQMLRENHEERRAVLQMWNCTVDLGKQGKDFPCNTQIYFKIRNINGRPCLHMTVCCRSNDIVFGCFGANVVHMSMLQEYMAAMIGVEVGPYWQVSDSWHAYLNNWTDKSANTECPNPYLDSSVAPSPMISHATTWDYELQEWMGRNQTLTAWAQNHHFFAHVASPLRDAWDAYKEKRLDRAIQCAEKCCATDLQVACIAWLQRRKK